MKITAKFKRKTVNYLDGAPITIGFIGDSVTHGCFEMYKPIEGGFTCNFRQRTTYHHILARMLETVFPKAPISVINAGSSGGAAPEGAKRLKRDIIDKKPDLCVVCFGLNDARNGIERVGEYEDALNNIFLQLRQNDIEAIFMTPNMMTTYVTREFSDKEVLAICEDVSKTQNDGTMDQYMESAIRVAKENNVKVCDCYGKWKKLYENGADITRLLSNRINHPTDEMHYLFAASLFETIMEL